MRYLFIAAAGSALIIPAPLEAQTAQGPVKRDYDFVDIARGPVAQQPRPTFSITERVSKNKDLSFEYQRASDRYRSVEDDMRLKLQIAPDAYIKWKGTFGARLTVRFK